MTVQQAKFLTRQTIPGTKMSPNPSREKGLSHSASGEEFRRGTFSTIGSWEGDTQTPGEKLLSPRADSGHQSWFLLHEWQTWSEGTFTPCMTVTDS